jgi:hypothetical protein
MPENPSSENAHSTDEPKEPVGEIDEQTNLGAGNEEPDPATVEAHPSEVRAVDKKRVQT